MDRLPPKAVVGWTASGTHDPNETALLVRLQRLEVHQCGAGRAVIGGDASNKQACKDAYATSKLCNDRDCSCVCGEQPQGCELLLKFDPGLMPGTGLAREQGAAAQGILKYVLPRLASILFWDKLHRTVKWLPSPTSQWQDARLAQWSTSTTPACFRP